MKKEINIERSRDFESIHMIIGIIKELKSLYFESDKINSIHISIDYDPSSNETVGEVLDKIYKELPIENDVDIYRAIGHCEDFLTTEMSYKVGLIMLLNIYSSKGWLTNEEFDEFARSFTVLYEMITKRKVAEHPLDWDEIGNFLTVSGMGYNVVGGFNIRKIYSGNPEKPYIITKISKEQL